MKKKSFTGIFLAAALLLSGCGQETEDTIMQDGTYTAQMAEFSHG